MAKALLVAAIFLFFSQLSYAAKYSTAVIDEECSVWARVVEKTAEARDEGKPKAEIEDKLIELLAAEVLDEHTYNRMSIILDWVYKWHTVKLEDLVFSYKDQCIDNLLGIERI